MTVEVERSFDVETSREVVWDLLSSDRNRARTIEVVDRSERNGEEIVSLVPTTVRPVER